MKTPPVQDHIARIVDTIATYQEDEQVAHRPRRDIRHFEFLHTPSLLNDFHTEATIKQGLFVKNWGCYDTLTIRK